MRDLVSTTRPDGQDTTAASPVGLPADFIQLTELCDRLVESRLGYCGQERFVIFAYCTGGEEVMWRDARSSGFGTGGWRTFEQEVVPAAAAHGGAVGEAASPGRDVILMDRARRMVYLAPRRSAEAFLAATAGQPLSTRPCLCAHDPPST
jgi:hypothetical protein